MIDKISVKISGKLFENCIKGYIMLVQKGYRSRPKGPYEKEV